MDGWARVSHIHRVTAARQARHGIVGSREAAAARQEGVIMMDVYTAI